jgi:RHS repeat-associated protein
MPNIAHPCAGRRWAFPDRWKSYDGAGDILGVSELSSIGDTDGTFVYDGASGPLQQLNISTYAYDAVYDRLRGNCCHHSAHMAHIFPTAARELMFRRNERGEETGLDYFGARYMSSTQGRFSSPDPLVWQSWQSGDDEEQARFRDFISNPQNFNLYTYGLNNPLKYNDPTGLDVEIAITFVGDVSDEEKRRIIGAVTTYYQNLKVGNVVVRDTADSSQDTRTFGQKLKDLFTKDYQTITVDLAHPNPFGNNKDSPDFVKGFNMARTGDPQEFFGDLRKSDPTQWSNIIAWRILHETIAHDFGIGSPFDQFGGLASYQVGTLVGGAYGRGRPGIPDLHPTDVKRLQDLLVPRTRSYGR